MDIETALKYIQNVERFEDLEPGSYSQLGKVKDTLKNCEILIVACKGSIAALSQNKIYPADIELAKSFLIDAIKKATD